VVAHARLWPISVIGWLPEMPEGRMDGRRTDGRAVVERRPPLSVNARRSRVAGGPEALVTLVLNLVPVSDGVHVLLEAEAALVHYLVDGSVQNVARHVVRVDAEN